MKWRELLHRIYRLEHMASGNLPVLFWLHSLWCAFLRKRRDPNEQNQSHGSPDAANLLIHPPSRESVEAHHLSQLRVGIGLQHHRLERDMEHTGLPLIRHIRRDYEVPAASCRIQDLCIAKAIWNAWREAHDAEA